MGEETKKKTQITDRNKKKHQITQGFNNQTRSIELELNQTQNQKNCKQILKNLKKSEKWKYFFKNETKSETWK